MKISYTTIDGRIWLETTPEQFQNDYDNGDVDPKQIVTADGKEIDAETLTLVTNSGERQEEEGLTPKQHTGIKITCVSVVVFSSCLYLLTDEPAFSWLSWLFVALWFVYWNTAGRDYYKNKERRGKWRT